MHLGPREIGQAADVVRVAVGQYDVLNVTGIQSKTLNPFDGCVVLVKLKPGLIDQLLSNAIDWISNVKLPDARIDYG